MTDLDYYNERLEPLIHDAWARLTILERYFDGSKYELVPNCDGETVTLIISFKPTGGLDIVVQQFFVLTARKLIDADLERAFIYFMLGKMMGELLGKLQA